MLALYAKAALAPPKEYALVALLLGYTLWWGGVCRGRSLDVDAPPETVPATLALGLKTRRVCLASVTQLAPFADVYRRC